MPKNRRRPVDEYDEYEEERPKRHRLPLGYYDDDDSIHWGEIIKWMIFASLGLCALGLMVSTFIFRPDSPGMQMVGVSVVISVAGFLLALNTGINDDELGHVIASIFIPFYWAWFAFRNIDRYWLPFLLNVIGGLLLAFGLSMPAPRPRASPPQMAVNQPPPFQPGDQRPGPAGQPPNVGQPPGNPVPQPGVGAQPPRQPVAAPNVPPAPKVDVSEVLLSGPVTDVAVGGAGRYLALHTPSTRKLAVFDVQQGKVLWEKQLPGGELHLAAGATHLIALLPGDGVLATYNLTTGERERTAPLPANLPRDQIHQICMGSASDGPLFVYLSKEKRTLAMDPASLRTGEVRWNHWAPTNAYGPLNMRASPDGSVLVGWGGGWAGLDVATFQNRVQLAANDKIPFSLGAFALPSADGRLIFIPGAIVSGQTGVSKMPQLDNAYLVPAREPGFFLALHTEGKRGLPGSPGPRGRLELPPVGEVDVCTDAGKVLFRVDGDEWRAGSDLAWEKCVHYYPSLKLLVTLTASKDRLRLRRF